MKMKQAHYEIMKDAIKALPRDQMLAFKANDLGKGSLNVPAGQVIKIPIYQEYSGVSVLLNKLNDER